MTVKAVERGDDVGAYVYAGAAIGGVAMVAGTIVGAPVLVVGGANSCGGSVTQRAALSVDSQGFRMCSPPAGAMPQRHQRRDVVGLAHTD
jgi:hypothetical protein